MRKDGHYNHGAKITVLFAIKLGDPAFSPHVCGSVQRRRRLVQCVHGVGKTMNIFRDFCNHICLEIEQHGVVETYDHRILIWDNLAAHHSAYVHQTMTGCEGPHWFSIVTWPQYHPKFVPIEYKICELANILRKRKEPNWAMLTLENVIYQAAATIKTFDCTFKQGGYRGV